MDKSSSAARTMNCLGPDGLYAKLARIQNTTFIEEGFEKLLVEADAR